MAKRFLITGASRGLGRGVAQYMLSQGWHVDVLGLHQPAFADIEGVRFIELDFSQIDSLPTELNDFVSDVAYDLVLLNAGVLNGIKDMAETPVGEIEEVMRVNVWANKCLLDALFEYSANVRQVVGISSGASVSGSRGWNVYALSKATLNMLISLYAAEREGTHFCALAPGLVDTGMQEMIANLPADERFPKMETLRSARGTDAMPDPDTLAPRLFEAIEEIYKTYPSGSFIDIRKMKGTQ